MILKNEKGQNVDSQSVGTLKLGKRMNEKKEKERKIIKDLIEKGFFKNSEVLDEGKERIREIKIPNPDVIDQNENQEETWTIYEMDYMCFIVTNLQHIYTIGNSEYVVTARYIINSIELNLCQNEKIKCIDHDNGSTFITTTRNKLFATGRNNKGQLGINSFSHVISTPKEVQLTLCKDEEIQNIYSSFSSTFITTTANRIFATGWNQRGQLGINSEERKVYKPIKVQLKLTNDEQIKSIHSEWLSTFILTTANRIYATGKNDCGQLGIDSTISKSSIPTRVILTLKPKEEIKSIEFDKGSILILTTSNRTYTTGKINLYYKEVSKKRLYYSYF